MARTQRSSWRAEDRRRASSRRPTLLKVLVILAALAVLAASGFGLSRLYSSYRESADADDTVRSMARELVAASYLAMDGPATLSTDQAVHIHGVWRASGAAVLEVVFSDGARARLVDTGGDVVVFADSPVVYERFGVFDVPPEVHGVRTPRGALLEPKTLPNVSDLINAPLSDSATSESPGTIRDGDWTFTVGGDGTLMGSTLLAVSDGGRDYILRVLDSAKTAPDVDAAIEEAAQSRWAASGDPGSLHARLMPEFDTTPTAPVEGAPPAPAP